MITATIRQAAHDWQERMQALEAQMDALRNLLDSSPDSPLIEAIYAVAGGYTREIAKQLEMPEEVLSSWWLEHNFGERPASMRLPGQLPRSISTMDELLQFISDDNDLAGES